MHCAAVVLAAGLGSRMGGRPKCLLMLDGVPLIERQVCALRAAGIADIVVVLGHYGELIQPIIERLRVQVVHQPVATHSQRASVQLGLGALFDGKGPDAAIPRECPSEDALSTAEPSTNNDAVLICPSDLPLLTASDYAELLAVYAARPAGAHCVGPVVDGVPGNPVVFDSEGRAAIEAGITPAGGGAWRREAGDKLFHWHTDNVHYVTDVDSQDDLERLAKAIGRALVWHPSVAAGGPTAC